MAARIALTLALTSVLLVVVAADRASACACEMVTVAQAYRYSEVVFVGKVTEVTEERLAAEPDEDPEVAHTVLWAKLEVEEKFKGVDGAVAVVSPGEKYSNCTVDLEVGKTYLVFADRGRDDARLYTNRCQLTGELARVADALAYCRRAAR